MNTGASQTDFAVIIVGGGPAGASAAIQLAQRAPHLAERTLLLDKAVFPREKLCGGGVVRQADRYLASLGVSIDVPSVVIRAIRFKHAGGEAIHRRTASFRVVRREEFDQALLLEAQRRGVQVLQGCAVQGLARAADGVSVTTSKGAFRGQVIIGADGTNSLVRRLLLPPSMQQRFVALEVLTNPGNGVGEVEGDDTATFDFGPAVDGLRGYCWDFPSLIHGKRVMNRGIGGSTWWPQVSLKDRFAKELAARAVDLSSCQLQGATAPLYDPSVLQGAERVLLAGDAVGIDPWFGEGISVAIGSGIVAAHAAVEAVESGSFSFHQYHRRLRDSAVGWTLRRSRAQARSFYRAARSHGGLSSWLGIGEAG